MEVRIYLGRGGRKYINVGRCRPDEWKEFADSKETTDIIKKCEDIITAMEVLEEEMTVENFNFHYSGEIKKPKEIMEAEKKTEKDSSKKSFILYMEMALEDEELRHGSWKNKRVVIDAVKRYGKLNTYGDLTPARIMDFDKWLHDGTRTDVTCSGYHKKIHKWVRQLVETEEIERDPYARVTIKHGKSKKRTPLTENELKKLPNEVISLFIFIRMYLTVFVKPIRQTITSQKLDVMISKYFYILLILLIAPAWR